MPRHEATGYWSNAGSHRRVAGGGSAVAGEPARYVLTLSRCAQTLPLYSGYRLFGVELGVTHGLPVLITRDVEILGIGNGLRGRVRFRFEEVQQVLAAAD